MWKHLMGVILFQSWDLLNWTDLLGIFLNVMDSKYVDLCTVKGKVVYKCCVKFLNRDKLDRRGGHSVETESGCGQWCETSMQDSL